MLPVATLRNVNDDHKKNKAQSSRQSSHVRLTRIHHRQVCFWGEESTKSTVHAGAKEVEVQTATGEKSPPDTFRSDMPKDKNLSPDSFTNERASRKNTLPAPATQELGFVLSPMQQTQYTPVNLPPYQSRSLQSLRCDNCPRLHSSSRPFQCHAFSRAPAICRSINTTSVHSPLPCSHPHVSTVRAEASLRRDIRRLAAVFTAIMVGLCKNALSVFQTLTNCFCS